MLERLRLFPAVGPLSECRATPMGEEAKMARCCVAGTLEPGLQYAEDLPFDPRSLPQWNLTRCKRESNHAALSRAWTLPSRVASSAGSLRAWHEPTLRWLTLGTELIKIIVVAKISP